VMRGAYIQYGACVDARRANVQHARGAWSWTR
jgi:hypothetical protein